MPETDEEVNELRMKRVEENDPVAMLDEGAAQFCKKGMMQRLHNWAMPMPLRILTDSYVS